MCQVLHSCLIERMLLVTYHRYNLSSTFDGNSMLVNIPQDHAAKVLLNSTLMAVFVDRHEAAVVLFNARGFSWIKVERKEDQ